MNNMFLTMDPVRTHALLMVLVIAAVTMMTRFLPFWLLGGKRQTPPFLTWLGKVLPYAIMGMLVVYCLRGIRIFEMPHGIPELLSCALVVILHVWKRNTLISIIGGTACYMVLVQMVF